MLLSRALLFGVSASASAAPPAAKARAAGSGGQQARREPDSSEAGAKRRPLRESAEAGAVAVAVASKRSAATDGKEGTELPGSGAASAVKEKESASQKGTQNVATSLKRRARSRGGAGRLLRLAAVVEDEEDLEIV